MPRATWGLWEASTATAATAAAPPGALFRWLPHRPASWVCHIVNWPLLMLPRDCDCEVTETAALHVPGRTIRQ